MRAALFVYSIISRLVTRGKNALYDRGGLKSRRAPLPVVSVGNITLGGTGKTPLVMEIMGHLLDNGFRPALVTRGYKGRWERRGGVLSDGRTLFGGWKEAGDEPVMAAQRLPRAGVFVGKKRYLSCLRAARMGFDVAVLDDGFQHRKLGRDLDIVVHDPGRSFSMRESFSSLKRAHVILLSEGTREEPLERISRTAPNSIVCFFSVIPECFIRIPDAGKPDGGPIKLDSLRGARALAFCGLAAPRRFFATLELLGLCLEKTIVFPDHHDYPARSWARITELNRRLKSDVVVTTEKDAVKLAGRPDVPADVPLHVLRIGLSLDQRFFEVLNSKLSTPAGVET